MHPWETKRKGEGWEDTTLTGTFPIEDPERDDFVSILEQVLHQPIERFHPRLVGRDGDEEDSSIACTEVARGLSW